MCCLMDHIEMVPFGNLGEKQTKALLKNVGIAHGNECIVKNMVSKGMQQIFQRYDRSNSRLQF